MRNHAKHHRSPALPGTSLIPGPQSEPSSAWCPRGAAPLPVSSLYSPSGHSTHSKQQVGSPSMIPFLVPARQSRLQLEKGTWRTEITTVRGCSRRISLPAPLTRVRRRGWALGPVRQTQAQSRHREVQRSLFLLSMKGRDAYGQVQARVRARPHTHLSGILERLIVGSLHSDKILLKQSSLPSSPSPIMRHLSTFHRSKSLKQTKRHRDMDLDTGTWTYTQRESHKGRC